ncbi:CAP domain-containing protein [Gemmobacter serpentinus]|uniref:CAP domain-containing protein n=1 Tax=Gemmobacter serpentinus TaxID=2652247 RepID=UPI00124C5CCD|nr:CAP domain-containing protein [Gemmobacter serpentinus]
MNLTAAEQYAIELINRARLDPAGEAKRYGVGLNDGLSRGTISSKPMQVVAPDAVAEKASVAHANWMIKVDKFDHRQGGKNDSAGDRLLNLGFKTDKAGWGWSENIGALTNSGRSDKVLIDEFHKGWMLSPAHRKGMLDSDQREIGYAHVKGDLRVGGYSYGEVGVEVFSYSNARAYVTGVAYTDKNKDGFYSIGEGTANLAMSLAGGAATKTMTAGGYSLKAKPGDEVVVNIGPSKTQTKVEISLNDGNVKLDVVGGTLLKVSGDAKLISGPIRHMEALGIGDIDLTGSAGKNGLTGNRGNNKLMGLAGDDTLRGGAGNDTLDGGKGADRLTGDSGADRFVFSKGYGKDTITDFGTGADRLVLDDALWSGSRKMTDAQIISKFADVTKAGVLFDFGGGDTLLLSGVKTTRGLADFIDVI